MPVSFEREKQLPPVCAYRRQKTLFPAFRAPETININPKYSFFVAEVIEFRRQARVHL